MPNAKKSPSHPTFNPMETSMVEMNQQVSALTAKVKELTGNFSILQQEIEGVGKQVQQLHIEAKKDFGIIKDLHGLPKHKQKSLQKLIWCNKCLDMIGREEAFDEHLQLKHASDEDKSKIKMEINNVPGKVYKRLMKCWIELEEIKLKEMRRRFDDDSQSSHSDIQESEAEGACAEKEEDKEEDGEDFVEPAFNADKGADKEKDGEDLAEPAPCAEANAEQIISPNSSEGGRKKKKMKKSHNKEKLFHPSANPEEGDVTEVKKKKKQ